MILRFKHFHDSLNIAVILAECEFFSIKCAQIPLKVTSATKPLFAIK